MSPQPHSPVVHNRTTTQWSRRRWLAAVGATFVSTSIGCGPDAATPPSEIAASSPEPSASAEPAPDGPPRDPLAMAVNWLWSKQARTPQDGDFFVPGPGIELPASQDGGWRSADYAQLRSGQALTPLAYHAILRSKLAYVRCPIHSSLAEDFLRKHVNAQGFVGADDPELLEYPNYASALTLSALIKTGDPQDWPLIERMRDYLVTQQYCEASGFQPEHLAYGGWGFGGTKPVGGSPGHIDIAHTRHVLQALRAAGHDDPSIYKRTEVFLRLLQKHPTEDRPQPSSSNDIRPVDWKPPYDGGFYFSPIVLPANKAGEDLHEGRPYFRSYATATCEGILALLACGVSRDDERIRAAVAWLEKHPRLDYPEGIPENSNENWGASIRYYHFAVRAECYAALEWPGDWRTELREMLAKLQQSDGSFVNREGFLMKEDDPILSTALAVIALSQ